MNMSWFLYKAICRLSNALLLGIVKKKHDYYLSFVELILESRSKFIQMMSELLVWIKIWIIKWNWRECYDFDKLLVATNLAVYWRIYPVQIFSNESRECLWKN